MREERIWSSGNATTENRIWANGKPMRWKRMWVSRALVLLVLLLCAGWAGSGNLAAAAEQAAEQPGGSGFTDIAGHWARPYIEWAAGQGLTAGYEDGTFRPDRDISEREFIALVFRAHPDLDVPARKPGDPWYAGYYAAAGNLGWPVADPEARARYTRGDAARIIAASRGQLLSMEEAVLYLLENGLSHGKTDATLEGYKPADSLTRAEALAFLYNIKQVDAKQVEAKEEREPAGFALRGIRIGDREAAVLAALGEPDRRDPAAGGYTWFVYNSDYAAFAQIGVSGGRVVALFSNADVWSESDGIRSGASVETVAAHAGVGERELRNKEKHVYEKDGQRITLYLDRHAEGRVEGVLVEDARGAGLEKGAPATADLVSVYERQIFDLANVFRLKNGLSVLEWHDTVADAARKHSEDMASRGYFDHESPEGHSPGDRLRAVGLAKYAAYAENIAAGYRDAFEAHNGWINSSGHRENLLMKELETLGVGAAYDADSKYRWYYTQKFYTPAWW